MASRVGAILAGAVQGRVARRWSRLAQQADTMDLGLLRALRGHARQMRRDADRLLHAAEARLGHARDAARAVPMPLHADWAWRPDLWRAPVSPPGLAAVASRTPFGTGATVFHDCAHSELTVRQIRNRRAEDLAAFGFRMDVFRFDGSFLSLAVDLPEAAVRGLTLRHLIRLDAVVEVERRIEIFARLNVRHGPNTEQLVRELPLQAAEVMVEFDLAYTRMNEKRVDRAWVDLIFEGPELNQIVLRDVTFSRRLRAGV
jgi:hypothetical protein